MRASSAFLFLLAPAIQTQAFQASRPWIHRGITASAPSTTISKKSFYHSPSPTPKTPILKSSSSSEDTTPTTTTNDPPTPPSKAQQILTSIHQSKLPFRIIVLGTDSVLETTSPLGPRTSLALSPKTNEPLMTFASEDKSFEFHVKVDKVCKVTFVALEKKIRVEDGEEEERKMMRVCRFLNEKGNLICSLILAEEGEEGVKWFEGMIDTYGDEVLM
mmetsp:Transcript_32846/g.67070  ORF Transcript_32846/g.67070 Transcript_32846/m.67070 type:complete len:217 (+) Transcript_32846:55-705(+)